MRKIALCAVVALLSASVFAVEPDKNAAKLDKELRKVNDVASVADGRRVVNRVMAEQFSVPRKQLVAERQRTGFAYGQMFVLHEIAAESQDKQDKFDALAAQAKQGRTIAQLAAAHDVELKSVLDETKKFNKELAKELVDESDDSPGTPDASDDSGDSYDPASDSEPADSAGMSPKQLAQNNAMVHGQGALHANSNAQGVGPGRGAASDMGSTRGVGMGNGGGASAGGRGRPPH